ncbi:MAG: hypothetical protein QOH06_1916 [Acidobacteriota bacterium]|jgi:hypothetical protein|nr:hypothetical protein [Acidobacteriota bacterium]
MPDRLAPGPYRVLRGEGDIEIPFYVIPFDKRGICDGPETRRDLLKQLAAGKYTDVFFFSHGWNNDWTAAIQRYEDFIHGYMKMRRDRSLPVPAGFKPLLVGIFWPSTALVFTEKEKGPQIAANEPAAVDEAIAEERREVQELAETLEASDAADLYELAQKTKLTADEAQRLAEIAVTFYGTGDDELSLDTAVSAEELLEIWRQAPAETDDLADLIAGGPGPETAGFLSAIDPRNVVRTLTVFKMKDRAGLVGSTGVHELLRDLLAAGDARLHLIGHSYGGKVVLSATCAGTLPRKVHSMLLLQPAVSHLSFAATVPTTSHPGGYRSALDRVENPILTTYSSHDFPLTKIFHLALRRAGDLGEAKIAAATGAPPSKYAALGGFGPRESGERLLDVLDAPARYPLDQGTRLYGIDATRTVGGHGDISNPSTWWALYNLASR